MRPRANGVLVIVDGATIRLRSRDAIALVARALAAERTSGAPKDAFVRRALDAMKADPARRWTVASLARAAGLSRAAFARRFHRATSQTPRAYLLELRLRLAAERLVDSDDALAAVASHVGYVSEFAFAKAFKRRFGVPPGVFRRTAPSAPIARAAA